MHSHENWDWLKSFTFIFKDLIKKRIWIFVSYKKKFVLSNHKYGYIWQPLFYNKQNVDDKFRTLALPKLVKKICLANVTAHIHVVIDFTASKYINLFLKFTCTVCITHFYWRAIFFFLNEQIYGLKKNVGVHIDKVIEHVAYLIYISSIILKMLTTTLFEKKVCLIGLRMELP